MRLRPESERYQPIPDASCGNDRHPDGAWHPLQPIDPCYLGPFWRRWKWRVIFWLRRRSYGCACPVGAKRD